MDGVRGILLDFPVLLSASAGDDDDVNVDTFLRPGAIFLLRKLRYSKIPFGISHARGLSSPKEFLLREMARTYSCTIFDFSAEVDISSEVARIWEGKGGTLIHVVSGCGADIYCKENGSAWLKVTVGSAEEKTSSDTEYDVETGMSNIIIQKLEELPLLICNLNKKAIHKEVLIVGYVMKPSREEDFAKRGAFPLRPTQNGLMFLPLNYELPLLSQLRLVDAVLHKATDEILAVDMGSPSEFSEKVTFTRNLQELQRWSGSVHRCRRLGRYVWLWQDELDDEALEYNKNDHRASLIESSASRQPREYCEASTSSQFSLGGASSHEVTTTRVFTS